METYSNLKKALKLYVRELQREKGPCTEPRILGDCVMRLVSVEVTFWFMNSYLYSFDNALVVREWGLSG